MTTQSAGLTAKTAKHTAPSQNINTARVRELNDNFRRDLLNPTLGMLVFSAGVSAMQDGERFGLIDEVRCFEDFNANNDPHHEHDFGALNFHGEKYFWKIDYYDKAMQFHSPDKSKAALTQRVLTIMQANEY
jgi:hypothetical protein